MFGTSLCRNFSICRTRQSEPKDWPTNYRQEMIDHRFQSKSGKLIDRHRLGKKMIFDHYQHMPNRRSKVQLSKVITLVDSINLLFGFSNLWRKNVHTSL